MYRVLNVMLGMLLAAAAARASPYWIEYEPANGLFPEESGWTRYYAYGGGERWIEDGAFVLDTRGSPGIYDYYVKHMYGTLDPAPGEIFDMQWRLRIEEPPGITDLDVGVFSDDKWGVGFHFDADAIRSVFEEGVEAWFTPGVFHDFDFISSDMRNYTLYIDGVAAIEGSFWLSLTPSEVGWGDDVQGRTSLSRWDYFSFGVTPEPSACWVALLATALFGRGVARCTVHRASKEECHV
jgi:hypothetical protein